MDTQLTINGSRLVTGSTTLRAHEAIAVVLQLADAIKEAGVSFVPDFPHIQLSSDGALTILPGSPQSGEIVPQLAARLMPLLQHAAVPAELARAVAGATEPSQAARPTVDDFVKSLEYFEVPGRPSVLGSIVERVAAASAADARLEQELEKFTAKAREAPLGADGTKSGRKPHGRRTSAVAIGTLLVVLAVGAAVGFVSWPLVARAAAGRGGLSGAMTRASHDLTQAFNSTVDRVFGKGNGNQTPDVSEADSAGSGQKATAHAVARRKKAGNADVEPTAGKEPAAPEIAALTQPSALLGIFDSSLMAATEMAPPRMPTPTVDPRVYTRHDRDVTPPIPLAPVIGHVTAAANVMPGDMDVVVGPTGEVERVILLTPNGYQDRMLIAAMKNRQFRPAMAHGHSVRYLLRVRTAS